MIRSPVYTTQTNRKGEGALHLRRRGTEEMRKIQTKIIAIVVLATVCVSVIAGIVSTAVTRYSTTSALEKNALETVKLAALAAENMISTYTLTIAEMASNQIGRASCRERV